MAGPYDVTSWILPCTVLLIITAVLYSISPVLFYGKVLSFYIYFKVKQKFHVFAPPKDNVVALPHNERAFDGVCFEASDNSGNHFVIAIERHENGIFEGFCYLLLDKCGYGLLEYPKLPGTAVYQQEVMKAFCAEDMRLELVEHLKKWRLSYDGVMCQYADRDNHVPVKFELEWKAHTKDYFSFNHDLDMWSLAKAVAREKWSSGYFKNLDRIAAQIYFEQIGTIQGKVSIDDHGLYAINMESVKCRQYGKRKNLHDFHRYAFHHVVLENGDRFTIGIVHLTGLISRNKLVQILNYNSLDLVPEFSLYFSSGLSPYSRLVVGYAYLKGTYYAIKTCDLQLEQHGSGGKPPVDYGFTFGTALKTYFIKVNVEHSPHYYVGKNWECKVFERFCSFNVDGLKGWGTAQWQYQNAKGKMVGDFFETPYVPKRLEGGVSRQYNDFHVDSDRDYDSFSYM